MSSVSWKPLPKIRKNDTTHIQFTYLGKPQSITPSDLTYTTFHQFALFA